MRKTLAKISATFLRQMMSAPHREIASFRTAKKWLTIHAIDDVNEAGVVTKEACFYYVERLGKDSVSVMARDATRNPEEPMWLVLRFWHGPIGELHYGSVTGSLDKPELTPAQIAFEELEEEAGMTFDDGILPSLTEVAYVPVSGNTNERVHLFVCDVSNVPYQAGAKAPEGLHELNTSLYWMRESVILERIQDWRILATIAAFNNRNKVDEQTLPFMDDGIGNLDG